MGTLVEATKAIIVLLNVSSGLCRWLSLHVIEEFTKSVRNAVVRSHGRRIEEIKRLESSGSGCLF